MKKILVSFPTLVYALTFSFNEFSLNSNYIVNRITKIICISGTLEINCSKDIKIQGVIGPCTSLEKVRQFGHLELSFYLH